MIRFTLLTVDTIHKTMKTKVAFLTFLATAVVSSVWAQSTEDDDMYFTSKDRAALNAVQSASRQEVLASASSRRITESEVASTINPTDSYSARNVNPEYISGSKMGSNSTASVQYFSPTYQPTSVNQNLASNNCNCTNTGYNGFNNGFNNSYGYNRFGSFGSPYGMGGMSPYGYNSYGMMNPYSNYGGYGYSPYSMMGNSMMMGSGFYGSGLSFGIGSGFGNSFGYGSPFGFGNYYGMNSYYGNSFYNPYSYGYGSGYGYGSRTVAATVDRPRPSSARNQEVDRYYSTDGNRGGVANSGGRVASVDNSQQYYNRTWRNDAAAERGTTTWNNTRSYQQNYNNGWNNSNNNSNWGGSNGGFSGGRSSSFSTGGGGGGFSGGSGGGGGGSRRGRD
jgi:hypothetical protein